MAKKRPKKATANPRTKATSKKTANKRATKKKTTRTTPAGKKPAARPAKKVAAFDDVFRALRGLVAKYSPPLVAKETPTSPTSSGRRRRSSSADARRRSSSSRRRAAGGRDFALHVRSVKALRSVPLVFAGGAPGKVASVRRLFPESAFADWPDAPDGLRRAIASPPPLPARPLSKPAGYSGTPLPRKLGVKPGAGVVLAGAPPADFEETLGPLPPAASIRRGAPARPGAADLVLWFVRTRRDLDAGLARMAPHASSAGLWIVWPKKTSPLAALGLDGNEVRRAGLAAGLVDFKVCAVDADWSGLRFARQT